MQVDELKTQPKFLWRHLYKEVEKQSDSCDVTVEVHSWRRKFHWCVLEGSPFFAKLYESKMREQQTGLIKIHMGTANSVQTAIRFLYGQDVQINLDDLGDVLEVAEFFMIAELKSLCISKLTSRRINKDNCLKFLMLASLYDFYFEAVSKFILANLPDLLETDGMLLLDRESVRFILTDRTLAYVNREDCFRYLVKWIRQSQRRQTDFAELFACLDNEDVLTTVDLNYLTNKCLASGSNRWCNVLAVYPFFKISGKVYLYLYNFKRKVWFKIQVRSSLYWFNCGAVWVSLQHPNMLVSFSQYIQMLYYHNLTTLDTFQKRIEVNDSDKRSDIDSKCGTNCLHADSSDSNEELDDSSEEDNCRIKEHFDSYDERYWPEKPFFRHFSISEKKTYCVRNVCGKRIYSPPLVTVHPKALSAHMLWKKSFNATRLYISEKEDNSVITLKSLVSIPGIVQSMCVADGVVCLLIGKKLIMYSEEELLVKKLDLSDFTMDSKSCIYQRVRGGIYVVTERQVLQICLQVEFSGISASISDVLDLTEGEYVHQILQDKIITATRRTKWYQSLPENISALRQEEKIEIELPDQLQLNSRLVFLQVTVPSEIMRCPVDCAHCRYNDRTETRPTSYEYVHFDDPGNIGRVNA